MQTLFLYQQFFIKTDSKTRRNLFLPGQFKPESERNFVVRSKDTVMALYMSLVRPQLEYCTPIWSSHLIKGIKLVEGVWQRATKLAQGIARTVEVQ